jgi:predicted transcriptional regulator
LKRDDVLTLLFIGVLLGVSFLSIASSQGDASEAQYLLSLGKPRSLVQSVVSIPIIAGVDLDEGSLNSSARGEIFDFVRDNPGFHFRGICRHLGLSIGVVQYHLDLLTSTGHLASRRERRYKRYFESGRFSETDIEVISALRNGTAKKIIAILLGEPNLRHADLASLLDISSQALTWQMKRLKATGLIEVESEGRRVRYSVTEENLSTITEFLDLLF